MPKPKRVSVTKTVPKGCNLNGLVPYYELPEWKARVAEIKEEKRRGTHT